MTSRVWLSTMTDTDLATASHPSESGPPALKQALSRAAGSAPFEISCMIEGLPSLLWEGHIFLVFAQGVSEIVRGLVEVGSDFELAERRTLVDRPRVSAIVSVARSSSGTWDPRSRVRPVRGV